MSFLQSIAMANTGNPAWKSFNNHFVFSLQQKKNLVNELPWESLEEVFIFSNLVFNQHICFSNSNFFHHTYEKQMNITASSRHLGLL